MSERRGTKGLELWCRRMTEGYPGVKIDNMTTSWRDGLAFCAIIHHFRPDLIEFSKLNKDDVYHNNELAFRVAEQYLGIPALLEPEDMVEFAVPDRLSILTYLSQFYQTFAVAQGKTGARLAPKRAQTTPDHGIVSPSSTSPPTKIAHIGAGRIRRDPCAKCALPVFIAERLNVGKLVYHRTCFRCARCNSQLTLANYYETECSEFCCEICPDEEKSSLTKKNPLELEEEHSVLTRSMSDEEKSASLKTHPEVDPYSTQFETALEFPSDSELKKTSTLTSHESTVYSKARSHFFKSYMEDTDSGNGEDIPPDLPKTAPPLERSDTGASGFPNKETLNIVNKSSVSEVKQQDNLVTKDNNISSSIVKSRMRLFEDPTTVFPKKTDVNNRRSISSNSDNKFNVPSSEIVDSKNEAKVVTLDELEDFDNISKKDVDLYNEKHSNTSDKNFEESSSSEFQESSSPEEINKDEEDTSKKDDSGMENQTISSENSVVENLNSTNSNEVIEILDSTNSNEVIEVLDSTNSKEEPVKKVRHVEDSVIVIEDSRESDELINSSSVEAKSSVEEDNENSSEEKVLKLEDLKEEDSSSNFEDNSSKEVAKTSSSDKSFDVENYISISDSKEDLKVKDISKEVPEILSNDQPVEVERRDVVSVNKQQIEKQESYPEDLNPFGEEEHEVSGSLNPFGDEDDENDEHQKRVPVPSPRFKKKIVPTDEDKLITGTPEHMKRIYIERISVNPFEDSEGDVEEGKKEQPPLPADRRKRINAPKISLSPWDVYVAKNKDGKVEKESVSLNPFGSDNEDEEVGESEVGRDGPVPKPRSSITSPPEPRPRDTSVGLSPAKRGSFGGSNESSLSSVGTIGSGRKKKPAPRPPVPAIFTLNVSDSPSNSLTSSPSQSVAQSPHLAVKQRKSKRAPLPPVCTSTPHPGEGLARLSTNEFSPVFYDETSNVATTLENDKQTVIKNTENQNDAEQEKSVKDEVNRNRQSQDLQHLQCPTSSENSSHIPGPNKSTFGKWKRHKGKAPSRPIPQRRSIKSLPIAEIRRELDIIEIQQQGLEKQGVKIEQIIREKCEGDDDSNPDAALPIEVEDLILQLFELVNEKNELFRKQAELMYLRRQQRLEVEHADVEYQIRCLMLEPEANKTDSDKFREEELIQRLVEIVERRNEIIECLEMDRVREAEEDDSINVQINLYTQNRDIEKDTSTETKKEKKKHKKINKLLHSLTHKEKDKNKIDADKDVDETEANSSMEKKKKKKFNLFS